MTTETEVKQASDQFYAALNQMLTTGDAGAVTAVWSQGEAGSTMHPLGGREVGRDQVLGTWEQAGPAFSDGRASAEDVVVIPLCDDVAYTVGTERFEGKVGGETMRGEWRATNIYRRENGAWKIVHHHTDASPKLMATPDNINVLRRVVDELINDGNLATFDDLFAPDFVEHERPPGVPQGREGTKQLFSALHAAFPDIQAGIEDIVAQDDKVVFRMTWQGTQTGEFMGIPPTGKRVAWDVFDMVRIEDGKIAEHWGLMDQLSLMQQLAVIPTSEEATV